MTWLLLVSNSHFHDTSKSFILCLLFLRTLHTVHSSLVVSETCDTPIYFWEYNRLRSLTESPAEHTWSKFPSFQLIKIWRNNKQYNKSFSYPSQHSFISPPVYAELSVTVQYAYLSYHRSILTCPSPRTPSTNSSSWRGPSKFKKCCKRLKSARTKTPLQNEAKGKEKRKKQGWKMALRNKWRRKAETVIFEKCIRALWSGENDTQRSNTTKAQLLCCAKGFM